MRDRHVTIRILMDNGYEVCLCPYYERCVFVRITKVLLRFNRYSLCCVYAEAYEVVSGYCIAIRSRNSPSISEVQKTSSFR